MTPSIITTVRFPEITKRQIADLCDHLGTTQTQILIMAIDRMHEKETRRSRMSARPQPVKIPGVDSGQLSDFCEQVTVHPGVIITRLYHSVMREVSLVVQDGGSDDNKALEANSQKRSLAYANAQPIPFTEYEFAFAQFRAAAGADEDLTSKLESVEHWVR